MTDKNTHTLISYNEHYAMLVAVKLSYENANAPLSRDYKVILQLASS